MLYSTGTQTEPDFKETGFCKNNGCSFETLQTSSPKIVPSLVSETHYDPAQKWLDENYQIETGGYIVWEQKQDDQNDE